MAVRISESNNINRIKFKEQGSDPSTPASGFGFLYVKSDGVYYKDDAGNVTGPFVDTVGGGGGGTTYGQAVPYPTTFTGDVIDGSSTTPFADVAAFDVKEVLGSRILHLVTQGASKDQRVRVTLGTPKAGAFDVRIALAVNAIPLAAAGGDYYTEVRLSTSADAQLAIAQIIPVNASGSSPAAYAFANTIRVGGASLASADANAEPKPPIGETITLRFVRDGSNVISFYFGFGTAPMTLNRITDIVLIPYTQTVSGTLARIEIAQHSPGGSPGPMSTAQIETAIDYVSSQ